MMMNKVTFNIHRTTVYRTDATLKKGDYFHYVATDNRRTDESLSSGIMLCVIDGKECVNLYTGDIVGIYPDLPVELVKNLKIEGDI